MRESARRTRDPEAGSVRLGIFPTLAPYLLPHVLPTVRERFPRLELLLVEEKTEIILRQLREGRLDVGVLALPLHDEQLHVQFLFEEPFVLAVPQSHALARRSTLTLHDLAHERLLLLEDGHCLRDQALDVCTLAGSGERNGFRATSLETLRQMVAANVGVTLLPALSVKPPVAQSADIHLLRFRDSQPSPADRHGLAAQLGYGRFPAQARRRVQRPAEVAAQARRGDECSRARRRETCRRQAQVNA